MAIGIGVEPLGTLHAFRINVFAMVGSVLWAARVWHPPLNIGTSIAVGQQQVI